MNAITLHRSRLALRQVLTYLAATSLGALALALAPLGVATLLVMAGLTAYLLSRPDQSWAAPRPSSRGASQPERSQP